MEELRIDVWYGKRQRFGHNGLPQQWINVLGRVRGPGGEPGLLAERRSESAPRRPDKEYTRCQNNPTSS